MDICYVQNNSVKQQKPDTAFTTNTNQQDGQDTTKPSPPTIGAESLALSKQE